VDVAVVEAGLGGRYDATNVIPSEVQVLTNVSLEHTRWLGPTITAIAEEKVDVVRPGARSSPGAACTPTRWRSPSACAPSAAPGSCSRRPTRRSPCSPRERTSGALRPGGGGCAAFLGELDADAVAVAAAQTAVPGRFEIVDEAPVTVFDGAHNPDG